MSALRSSFLPRTRRNRFAAARTAATADVVADSTVGRVAGGRRPGIGRDEASRGGENAGTEHCRTELGVFHEISYIQKVK